jgi:hypothetical protein
MTERNNSPRMSRRRKHLRFVEHQQERAFGAVEGT